MRLIRTHAGVVLNAARVSLLTVPHRPDPAEPHSIVAIVGYTADGAPLTETVGTLPNRFRAEVSLRNLWLQLTDPDDGDQVIDYGQDPVRPNILDEEVGDL